MNYQKSINKWAGKLLRVDKRPLDMPMTATIMRERKGVYIAIIKFAKSHREYGQEPILAKTKAEAARKLKRMFPQIKVKRS